MKNTLAENMLRFGTKNISNHETFSISFLNEQTDTDVQTTDTKSVLQGGSGKDTGETYSQKTTGIDTGKNSDGKNPYPNPYVTSISTSNKGLTDQVKLVQSKYRSYLNADQSAKYEAELIATAGKDTYTKFLESLSDNDVKTTARLWFMQVSQDGRKTMLQKYAEFVAKRKGEISKFEKWFQGGDPYRMSIIIRTGNEKIKAPELPLNPVNPPVDLGFTIEQSGGFIFVDNESTVTEIIKTAIDNNIKAILTKKADTEKQLVTGGTVSIRVDSISIESSASRYMNTGRASNLTWAKLSEERSNNVKAYLLQKFKDNGIVISNDVVTVYGGGTNLDGTSGPNPPVGSTITTNGITPGKSVPTGPKKVPHATKQEYDVYKYVIIAVEVKGIPVIPVKPETDQGESITVQNFGITFLPLGVSKYKDSGYRDKIATTGANSTVLTKKNSIISRLLKK